MIVNADIGKVFFCKFPKSPTMGNHFIKIVDRLPKEGETANYSGNWILQKQPPFLDLPMQKFTDVNNNLVDGRENFEVTDDFFNDIDLSEVV